MEGGDAAHGVAAGVAGEGGGWPGGAGGEVGGGDLLDGAGFFAGGRVGLGTEGLDEFELVGRGGGGGPPFGEDADRFFILAGLAGGGVAADDIVVEDFLEIPGFGFGKFGEMPAAVEALFFASDGDEDDGGGEFELREDACGFE